MEIFIDSSNRDEIEKWLKQGVVDGVTTNPSIMLKEGVRDIQAATVPICSLLGARPVSVEVTSNDHGEMLHQARTIATWASNIVVKIPIINQDGISSLGVVHTLAEEGIAVNATAILSFNQAILAVKAGATYTSIFAGRVADEGNDPGIVIRNVRSWLDSWGFTTKIIVGSIRACMDVQSAALAGAHIITIPPQFLPKMVDHKYTRETVRQFNDDAAKASEESMKKMAVRV